MREYVKDCKPIGIIAEIFPPSAEVGIIIKQEDSTDFDIELHGNQSKKVVNLCTVYLTTSIIITY